MKKTLIAASLSLAAAGAAQAEGWTVTDFSALNDLDTCMKRVTAKQDTGSRSFWCHSRVFVNEFGLRVGLQSLFVRCCCCTLWTLWGGSGEDRAWRVFLARGEQNSNLSTK